MFTVRERTIEGVQPRRQFDTFEEALAEAATFVQEVPGAWQAYITNGDSVILADLKGW